MSSTRFDVVVVGGGPAGSLTSYFLAKAGVSTALLDGRTFPRPKPCGGGLQARAMLEIPFHLGHLLRGALHSMNLSYGLRNTCTRHYPEPLVYSILRSEFDHFLLQRAAQAGVRVYEGHGVRAVELPGRGPAAVRTGRGDFLAQCLVGADGANSLVRGALNRRRDFFWQAAVSCEIPEEAVNEDAVNAGTMIVDWGSLPSGYAWAFPKRGSVNVGAGGPIAIARHLKSYVSKFVETAKILKKGFADRLILSGHQLPTLTRTARLSAARVLLVGDAAGVVEPFTGDGISFACRSARIAARSILGALNIGDLDLTAYGAQLISEIGSELWWSRKLLSVSVAFPGLIYRLFRTNDRVWNTFCKTLRGETNFHRLKKDVLGPFEFAWRAIDTFTQLRERTILNAKSVVAPLITAEAHSTE